MPVTPVFILSLPRSGSTLLQRILAAHSQVATTSEPWFLLPLLYSRRSSGVSAEYGHRWAAQGVADLLEAIPRGPETFEEALRHLALDLYEAAASGAPYFVDKTPRYHLIVQDLISIFPDAKFIVLWRNPLAVVASMLRTWSRWGRWIGHRFDVDLYKGMGNLVASVQAEPTRFWTLRYEDLVTSPEVTLAPLFDFLSLDFEPQVLSSFTNVSLSGRMGDPTGTSRYSSISAEPLDLWRQSFASPVRKAWAVGYLSWLGKERLAAMGYEQAELTREVRSVGTKLTWLVPDVISAGASAANTILDASEARRRFLAMLRGERVLQRE